MPSFDLVSKIDSSELHNALEQTKKEIAGRFDFKGSTASIELKEEKLHLQAEDDYKIKALLDIFRTKMVKRGIGVNAIEPQKIEPSGNRMLKQDLLLKSGIAKDDAKTIHKMIKDSKLKVTASTLEDKIRITGKKIDDLQAVFAMLKKSPDIKIELQMDNIKRD